MTTKQQRLEAECRIRQDETITLCKEIDGLNAKVDALEAQLAAERDQALAEAEAACEGVRSETHVEHPGQHNDDYQRRVGHEFGVNKCVKRIAALRAPAESPAPARGQGGER